MIRKLVCMLVVVLLFGGDAVAKPRKMGSLRRVGKVVTFPVVHPAKTVKGILYGAFNSIGTVVDGVEYVTGEIAQGVSKVDALIDSAETKTSPLQTGAQRGEQHPHNATP